MKILVANIGSTSLKYRLFDFSDNQERLLARGGVERVTDYSEAIRSCLKDLTDQGHIQNEKDLAAVGFKTVVARDVTGCVPLNEEVLQAMEACNYFAPAHNPPYIVGIRLFREIMPHTPLIALFETAFYQWTDEASRWYAVPKDWYDAGVRRYGFHGASHKYIAERSADLLNRKDVADRTRELYIQSGAASLNGPDLRIVSCHLGGSSSITGIRSGVAIGNSMGLSPQSGLPHNNRVGDLDAFALPYMMREKGLSLDEVERILCKESGLKGISQISNDLRDIQQAADAGNAQAELALNVFVHQARHWIGAFHWDLNGLDALAFTAGIGENRASIRSAICRDLEQLGLQLDEERNQNCQGREGLISRDGSRIQVWVIPTNEELVVARETARYLQNN